ncbi:hypothetical protein XPN_3622 [Xanthomonas arboricola pv. pruni MAFF 301427]|nr:hypothetical protein XPN_3622 [Xanthomonas arboricola pv. pruni MAFF 301427]
MQLPAQWQAGIDRNTEVLRGHAQLLASFNAPRPAAPDTTTPRGLIASIVSTTRSQPTLAARLATQTLTRINQANDSCVRSPACCPHAPPPMPRACRPRWPEAATGGALAGVPFVVKDLFDVAGQVTTAGAVMRAQCAPASRDAAVVQRLSDAGAVLVGTANMDEFAYGFATVNAHYGTTANPHDHRHLAGGSSGGSAAAVAAGLVPFALGSDTNGSIRVPAALCGVYGLRPTHGALPLDGVFGFVDALDVVGPFASSIADLRRVHEVMLGRPLASCNAGSLRIARLGGWFQRNLDPELDAGLGTLLTACNSSTLIELPEAERARAAAFVLTAAEGGHRHRAGLSTQSERFDPATRDRLLAGLQLPASAVADAHASRSGLAPPCSASGTRWMC